MPLKIDLGKIFPGIIILIIGLVLLVIWIIVMIVSFFFTLGFYFPLVLLIITLGCITVGIIIIFQGISGWKK